MNLEETREKILTDPDFVVSETKKLLCVYELKHVIRYDQVRPVDDFTESDAEHIFGMFVVAEYFLPIEDRDGTWDAERINKLILWHELGEIETGDINAPHKTDADRKRERDALPAIIARIPDGLQESARSLLDEYEEQGTPESRFVKAIDKLEPLIHTFHPLGKAVHHANKLTTKRSAEMKEKHLVHHPYIKAFVDSLHKVMDQEGHFYDSPSL